MRTIESCAFTIVQYLVTNDLLTRKQFGFRKGLSTVYALTYLADEFLLDMEQGKLCGAMFLDLTKAFDTVDHWIVLRTLSEMVVLLLQDR